MSESVGVIYYEVEADTAKLLNSGKQVDGVLSQMQGQFDKTDKAANAAQFQMTKTAAAVKELGRQAQEAQNPLGGLSKMIGGLLTLQGASSLIQMAEAYNEMAERVRMASASQEEYEMVQQRLLATANATYRSMSEAQEGYILTADALRSMGYTTSQALDITDSLSFAFVKNAANAQRAESALSAFTGSIQTGRVSADAWKAIIAATPSVVDDLAASMGKTTAEIRKMGVEGKLVAANLTEGLRKSVDGNKQAAADMATTVKDAFTALRNNLSAYIGELNQSSGATGVLSAAVLGLGNNIDTLVKLVGVAAAGAMARYIAQLGVKTLATLRDIAATRTAALAEVAAARAQVATAQAALAETAAMAQNATTKALVTARTNALTAAQTALTVASRASGTAMGLAAAALGGPVGIITLAATAAAGMVIMSSKTLVASVSFDDFAKGAGTAAEKLEKLNDAQKQILAAQSKVKLSEATDELNESLSRLIRGAGMAGDQTRWTWIRYSSKEMESLNAQLQAGELSSDDFAKAATQLVGRFAAANRLTEAQRLSLLGMIDVAARSAEKVREVAKAADELNRAASGAAGAQEDLNNALGGTTEAGQKAIANLERQIALYGKAGSAAGVLYDIEQARQGKGDYANFSEKELGQLEDLAKKQAQLDARKPGQQYATSMHEALSYYQGLVAENASAMEKIDAEERKAVEDNNKRMAASPKQREVYERAGLEITKKFARERGKLDEQFTQEAAELNIQLISDAEEKIAAIRDEALRRADAGVRLNVRTVEQAERDKQAAINAYSVEREKNANQLAKTAAEMNIAATQSEVQKIQLIWQEALRQADANYKAGATTFAQSEADKVKAATDAANALRSLTAQHDPISNEQQRFQQQMDSLKKLNEAKLIEDQRYRDLTAGAERSHQLQMQAIQEQTFAAQSAGNQILIGSLNQLQQVGTSTLTGLLSGATNGTDAMRALAGAVMNEVVGSFVQMGIAQVKAWVMGRTAQAAAAAGYVASVTGQVAATTALAAQAAFASTAAIPIVGPALAPGAAALAGAAAAALGAPAIAGASATLAGGRQYGGPVTAGKMYRINETGAPEVLNMANGQQFMLPNGRGEVVSNKDATSGSGSGEAPRITVNLIEDGSRGGQVDQQQVGDETILNVVVASIRKGGDVATAMEGTYGLARRGR